MAKLSKKDTQEITRFRSLLPKQIQVSVRRSEDGGFVANVKSFPGVLTEAETFSELIGMVNDAVCTYFSIPERYRSFLAIYLPPVNVAADLSLFPVRRTDEQVTFRLAVDGKVAG